MPPEFVASRLDIKAFSQAGASLSADTPLSRYERLSKEAVGQSADRLVHWEARGSMPADASGHAEIWLHLTARLSLPMICQRCLGPVDVPLEVDRAFRFVATEEQAEAQDELAEEDVLVLSRDFNLHELIEDELLMALPVVPRHEVCPTEVKLRVQDADFEAALAEKPKPFAALAGIKLDKTGNKR